MAGESVEIKTRAILLATDSTACSDRAADRAKALAERWKARLIVLNVLPATVDNAVIEQFLGRPGWPAQRTGLQQAETRLMRSLGEIASTLDVSFRIEIGNVGETLLRVAEEENCELIVTGTTREAFKAAVAGSTITYLSRHSKQPVLIVHDRPRHAYNRIVVASDFSDSSRYALNRTLEFFPDPLGISIVHGYSSPRTGLMTREASRDAALIQERGDAREQAHAFLGEVAIADTIRDRMTVVIEEGEPARLLKDYARDHDADLLVLGTYGRSALYSILLGHEAEKILEQAQIDTLLIRAPREG